MKIQLQIKDKEVIFPEFNLLFIEKPNHIVLAIKGFSSDNILNFRNYFEAKSQVINTKGGFLFVTTDKVYGFDLNGFSLPQNEFYLGFAFYGENDKIYDNLIHYIFLSCESN